MKKIDVRQMTQMAVLAALSIALVYLVRFPIFPSAPFLEYDPADITLIMGAFLYGPAAALILTVVVGVVQGFTVSAQSGVIGIIMHIVATGSYVLVAGFIYMKMESLKGIVVALLAGTVVMCALMAAMNLILTPIFMGVPRAVVASMILPVILPFNLIKAAINSCASFILFKSVGHLLKTNKD